MEKVPTKKYIHIREDLELSENREGIKTAKDLPEVEAYTASSAELMGLYGDKLPTMHPKEYLEYNGMNGMSLDQEIPEWAVCRSEIKQAPDGSDYVDVYALKGHGPQGSN